MTALQFRSRHIEISGRSARFFDDSGTLLADGNWGLNFPSRGKSYVTPPIQPHMARSAVGILGSCIRADVRNGNGDRLGSAVMRPDQAVVFCLEGGFAASQLAVTHESDYLLRLSGIQLEGRTFDLWVDVCTSDIYTGDKDGNPI